MALPNFYILGAQKSGTTWLASTLRQHPEIFIPRRKEINYFNRETNYELGRAWYEAHFREFGSAIAIGEATPDYLAVTLRQEHAKIIERILSLTPNARFIISLRNPVTRAISGLLHDMRQGRRSPWIDLDAEINLLISRRRHDHVLEFGQYVIQIRQFLSRFPIDRFAFIIYELEILTNKRRTLQNLCRFLRVHTDFEFRRVNLVRNPAIQTRSGLVLSQFLTRGRQLIWHAERLGLGKKLSISPDTLRSLYQFYESDWEELSALIGRNLEIWRHPRVITNNEHHCA